MADRMIYLAAPLFNERERAFNAELAASLEFRARVYLPQRDGSLLTEMIAAGVPIAVAERRVFQQDCKALGESDLLVAVLDGAHIDEGVAFEVGFARALGCSCYGLQTDSRRALLTGNNPMIQSALEKIFLDKLDLIDFIISEEIPGRSKSPGRRQL